MKKILYVFLGVALAYSGFYAMYGRNQAETSIALIKSQVDQSYDKSNQNVINAAVAAYYAETGKTPDDLQEVVDYGLLDPDQIVDHKGDRMTFDKSPYESSILSKSCGACGKPVSSTSKVGDICPHCGVRWGYETTRYESQ